jgi:hypothetical protein
MPPRKKKFCYEFTYFYGKEWNVSTWPRKPRKISDAEYRELFFAKLKELQEAYNFDINNAYGDNGTNKICLFDTVDNCVLRATGFDENGWFDSSKSYPFETTRIATVEDLCKHVRFGFHKEGYIKQCKSICNIHGRGLPTDMHLFKRALDTALGVDEENERPTRNVILLSQYPEYETQLNNMALWGWMANGINGTGRPFGGSGLFDDFDDFHVTPEGGKQFGYNDIPDMFEIKDITEKVCELRNELATLDAFARRQYDQFISSFKYPDKYMYDGYEVLDEGTIKIKYVNTYIVSCLEFMVDVTKVDKW